MAIEKLKEPEGKARYSKDLHDKVEEIRDWWFWIGNLSIVLKAHKYVMKMNSRWVGDSELNLILNRWKRIEN